MLQVLEKNVPGLAVVRLRRAALERRAGDINQSEALLQEAVAESKEKPTMHAFYSIKLARLLQKLGRDLSKARKVLQEALEISPVREPSRALFSTKNTIWPVIPSSSFYISSIAPFSKRFK